MIQVCFPLVTKFFTASTQGDQVVVRATRQLEANGQLLQPAESIAAPLLTIRLANVEITLKPGARPNYPQEHAKCLIESEQTPSCRQRSQWDWLLDWANEDPVRFSYMDATHVLSVKFRQTLFAPENQHFLLIMSRMLELLNLSLPLSEDMRRDLANLRETNVSSIVDPFNGIVDPGYELAWLEFWAFCIDHYFPECIPFINASLGECRPRHGWFCCFHAHSREPIEGPLAEFLVLESPGVGQMLIQSL